MFAMLFQNRKVECYPCRFRALALQEAFRNLAKHHSTPLSAKCLSLLGVD